MPRAQVNNGIELEYETFGDQTRPALLLIMGLGVQMLGWDERFCNALVDRGFFVIRFDNRDVGLSTHTEGPIPNPLELMGGNYSSASYTLDDLADDTAGLLDHLGIAAAHVVGASMGGMVAQTLAAKHPERVLSLTSIMSTTGNSEVGQPKPEALTALITPMPGDRAGYIEGAVSAFKVIGSPKYPADEERLRDVVGRSYDRSYNPVGFLRQLAGIMASGDRTETLRQIKAPTLVIHGEDDPLIVKSGGEATAAAIPGAKLVVIPGMGHDLPPELWPQFIDEIVENTERAAVGGPAPG
ncbi:MAG TPA: alpha/beta hydrolase [Solirubrobacterales bacterium]|nr:alpha/beta hydrolase [Solirubrobacterales bacterium]